MVGHSKLLGISVIALGASCSAAPEPAPVADSGTDVGPMADAPSQDGGLDAGDGDTAVLPAGPLRFGPRGSLSAPSGAGSFRFGAATAAAQIEDGLTNNDWYWWTLPEEQGGLGKGEAFVGDASRGYTRALEDVGLLEQSNLDAYRFSVDWSRIEPRRDEIATDELEHYAALLDALVTRDIAPMITIHHFSSPIWVHDFREDCNVFSPISDTNLCGWAHPEGADAIIEELAEHAGLLAATFGDRVDDWCTVNEPINYLFAAYGAAYFPPGEPLLLTNFDRFRTVLRNYIRAHVAIYDAIAANDTLDADGDGRATNIGLSMSVVNWKPARDNAPSDDPADVAARDRMWYVFHHLFPDAVTAGGVDTDFDGVIDEPHPEWANRLDWLGVQYYFTAGVTSEPALMPGVEASVCFGPLDFGACLPISEPTKWVPTMEYEFEEDGLYLLLTDYAERYPSIPLVISETGIAAKNGRRRAEVVVRTLEQTRRAMLAGVDVRGLYHWSLIDNFEWAEGYEPQFGLYSVDRATFERTPSEGATVLGQVAGARELDADLRQTYGGVGPMTPELE